VSVWGEYNRDVMTVVMGGTKVSISGLELLECLDDRELEKLIRRKWFPPLPPGCSPRDERRVSL
jgi:hypothetical protein